MDIFSVFTLFGGLAMFLYGMNVMGDGLEKLGGGRFESILERLTMNPVKGVFLGALITAVIQSSSATTVMVVGFVNSGIMRLSQAIGIIMGANVGTTITSWILSLSGISGDSFIMQLCKPSNFTPVLALIGIIMMMFAKNESKKTVGNILIAFAVLMFGMDKMSAAVSPLKDVPKFTDILVMFNNPVFGVIAGALLTAVIQSSSASVGILQALSATGKIRFGAAIPIIMGQNIGTCVTALISCIGTNKNAKRAAVVHLYFNIIGTFLFLILFYSINAMFDLAFVNDTVNAFYIAVVHTIFNLSTTLLLLPFGKVLEKLAVMTIPDDDTRKEHINLLDERFLQTPSYAVERCFVIAENMAYTAQESILLAVQSMKEYSPENDEIIVGNEKITDKYEDMLGSYLVKLSSKDLSVADSQRVSVLLHTIGDFERIADYGLSILRIAREINTKKITFSEKATEELSILKDAVEEALELTVGCFTAADWNEAIEKAEKVEVLEDVIDALRTELKKRHIKRLQDGRCTIELGFIFSDYIGSLEKVSDHCLNIALCLVQINDESYDIHSYIKKRRKSDAEYRNDYLEYSKKYEMPYSASGLKTNK
ncbi:MAG: Na/Pi cotransporter family protein [Oscillospiraceae bacterium]|nr:Na/Pi cotransporter family protein [Oscillospiraceae bacterium]